MLWRGVRKEIGDKGGIAHSLFSIGNILHDNNNLDGAMEKYEESFAIAKEIGFKSVISWALNGIGVILGKKGNPVGAKKKFEESLEIKKEIGNRAGIASSLHNIGAFYFEYKDYHLAMENLFKSIALSNQIGIKKQNMYDYIFNIRKIEGFKKFKNLAEETFSRLPEDLKPFIDMKEFTEDKTVHVTKSPERNAPCPCGSGKKYKKCCGR